MFSPRARGCSLLNLIRCCKKMVFPACAGMFLLRFCLKNCIASFPRVRGDVPVTWSMKLIFCRFSPRARGCSGFLSALATHANVFPACAGMFPQRRALLFELRSFPRVRGDVPTHLAELTGISRFSPRARGCSYQVGYQACGRRVFPACAGMFLGLAN